MAITQRRLTLEEFLKLPEEEPALEFFDGVVTQKVSPNNYHSWFQVELAERFNRFGWPRRIVRAFPEARATFAGASPVPDIVVYRRERIPRNPDGTLALYSFVPPDILVEIVSPGQTVRQLSERCQRFVEHGVEIALLLHPLRRWIRLFRPGMDLVVRQGADRIDLDSVLPGFELTVQELFDSLTLD